MLLLRVEVVKLTDRCSELETELDEAKAGYEKVKKIIALMQKNSYFI